MTHGRGREKVSGVGLFRRRREEEEPLAGLRGDGSVPFGGSVTPSAASPSVSPGPLPPPSAARPPTFVHAGAPQSTRIPARILRRRETGVTVAGAPRVRLELEVQPEGKPAFVIQAGVPVAPGDAGDVGDFADVVYDRDGRMVQVDLRPRLRPAR